MTTILVTGGIGSGKSAVCRCLSSAGVPVYDSDSRAKALYDTDPELLARVADTFGSDVLDASGRLDRKSLAAKVFGSKEALATLNGLVHPAVLRDFLAWRESLGDLPVAVMESALAADLPEYMALIDKVLLVDAPLEMRIERACKRDSATREAILARIASQSFDASVADAVLVNDCPLEQLPARVASAMERIIGKNSIFADSNNNEQNMKTDLARILSVSGKHGLYLYLAQARNGAIAESLSDKTRTVFDMKSRITTLADIAIYTSEGEMKLQEVFLALQSVLGEADAPGSKASSDELKGLFEKAVPNYDGDRFYVSHMKKVVDWYNELKNYASLDFVNPEDAEAEAAEE